MKRAFLVPVAMAISALSSNAQAAVADQNTSPRLDDSQANAALAAKRAMIGAAQRPITTYTIGSELFGFVLEYKADGQVFADHSSHSSHSSHASHASHASGQ